MIATTKARSGGFAPRTPQQRLAFAILRRFGAGGAIGILQGLRPRPPQALEGSKGRALSGVQGQSPWPWLAGVALLALTACGSPPPPPPVLTLNIVGSAMQNAEGGQGTAVAVRVYQLASTGRFQSTDVYSLMGSEATVLGTDEMGPSVQYLVAPGASLTETIALKPTVTDVGFAVLYRKINQSTWRLTAPVKPNGPSVVTLRIGALAATIDPPKQQ